jgi:hypothetical protein
MKRITGIDEKEEEIRKLRSLMRVKAALFNAKVRKITEKVDSLTENLR